MQLGVCVTVPDGYRFTKEDVPNIDRDDAAKWLWWSMPKIVVCANMRLHASGYPIPKKPLSQYWLGSEFLYLNSHYRDGHMLPNIHRKDDGGLRYDLAPSRTFSKWWLPLGETYVPAQWGNKVVEAVGKGIVQVVERPIDCKCGCQFGWIGVRADGKHVTIDQLLFA